MDAKIFVVYFLRSQKVSSLLSCYTGVETRFSDGFFLHLPFFKLMKKSLAVTFVPFLKTEAFK